MQRDNGCYFEDKLTWWFNAGQFYYTDVIEGLTYTFADVLYEIIDFLYNIEDNNLYTMLRKNEESVNISGILKNKKEASINLMQQYRQSLLNYNWDSVILNMIEYKDRLNNIPSDVMYFFNFKSKLLEQRKIIASRLSKEQIVDKVRISNMLESLKEYGITKTHWISRVFNNHYCGSCYDILFSPLFTLVNIGKDISRDIKQISDILISLDNLPNISQRSILVILKERIRIFDELGSIVLEAIINKTDNNNIFNINKILIEKGIPPKHRYILNDSMYWLCSKGCLKGIYNVYTEDKHILNLFYSWQPVGVKLLIDYPYS